MLLLWLAHVPSAHGQVYQSVGDLRQEGDYDINNELHWNGLATFAALAEGANLPVQQQEQVDWKSLGNEDLLILLYPTTNTINVSHVERFIRGGGRVLIADDFGAGASIFSKLGAYKTASIDADEFHDNQLFAPVAHATGVHQLSRGVLRLTSNHPGAIINLRPGVESIFEFSGGETLVAAGTLGSGRFVILTDPSVLINRMLQFEGNLEFAINLLRYLGTVKGRVVILSGNIRLEGEPRNLTNDGTWRGEASMTIDSIDRWLGELNLWLFTTKSLRVVTVIFAALLGLLAFLTLPVSRQRALDGSWTRPGEEIHMSLSETYQHAGARSNYLLPAAIERDNVNLALELALQMPSPLDDSSEQELLSAAQSQLGLNTTRALKDLLPRLRNIPLRAQAASQWEPRHLGRGEFESLHTSASRFFDRLRANSEDT